MSRARSFTGPDGTVHWFDGRLDSRRATVAQLELLADTLGIDVDDLLDGDLTQGEVKRRLHDAMGNTIPPHVLEARRARKAQQGSRPKCRICTAHGWECEGSITRHHFIPRWLMRELQNYDAYAARSICTIPICVGRHRDLHFRGEGSEGTDKSIVQYLTETERALAQRMLDDLHEQRPVIFDLIAGGNEKSYEWQLIRDYQAGLFRTTREVVEANEQDTHLSVAL